MAKNTTYSDLKQYIFRKLGSPIINVEVHDDQLEDCIDEAVHEFIDYHYSGVNIGYIPLQLIKDQTEYQLDDNVEAILNILTEDMIALDTSDPLLVKRIYVGESGYTTYPKPDIVSVEVFRQSVKLVADQYTIPVPFDFNSTTHKLYLDAPPTKDKSSFLKVYVSEENIDEILKNFWIKKFATALARRQWAFNVSKYTQVSLPGGAQFNFETLFTEAEKDIEHLMEELEDKYSEPLDPIIA